MLNSEILSILIFNTDATWGRYLCQYLMMQHWMKWKQRSKGTYGETKRVHWFQRLIFSTDSNEWDGLSRGLCSGRETSVSITFLTPDGVGISTSKLLSGDIEDIAIISQNLHGALLSTSESRAGTIASMGKDSNHAHATGQQDGAAYLSQRNVACVTCDSSWTEYKKFTQTDCVMVKISATR